VALALIEREVAMQIHRSPNAWTIIIYAPEDPEAATFVRSSRDGLHKAVCDALDAWDTGAPDDAL
jgi:hypothetical protein